MRAKFILLLAAKLPKDTEPPPSKPGRVMMRSSHRGLGAKRESLGAEDAKRQLALSINQSVLLNAGFITWTQLKLTPCVVTIQPEVTNDPAKN